MSVHYLLPESVITYIEGNELYVDEPVDKGERALEKSEKMPPSSGDGAKKEKGTAAQEAN